MSDGPLARGGLNRALRALVLGAAFVAACLASGANGATDFGAAVRNDNDAGVAAVLDAAQLVAVPPDLGALIAAAAALPTTQQRQVLIDLGAHIQAATLAGFANDVSNFSNIMETRALFGGSSIAGWFAGLDAGEPRHGFTAWGEGFAEYDVLQDSWNGIGVNTISFGAAAGIEQSLDADNRLGFAIGYVDSHLRIRPQDAYLRDISVGVYGLHRMDGFLFDGEASVSVSSADTQRAINAGTFTETAHGSGVGYGFGASGGVGYPFHLFGFGVLPRLGFDYAWVEQSGMTENGAPAADLTVASGEKPMLYSVLSTAVVRPYVLSSGGVIEPSVTLGYRHQWLGKFPSVSAYLDEFPSQSFMTSAASETRNVEVGSLRVDYRPLPGLGFNVQINQLYGVREHDFQGLLGMSARW